MTYTFDTAVVSDLHKDAYGSRPSESFWMSWDKSSDEDKQIIWDGLIHQSDARYIEEQAQQLSAIESFEQHLTTLVNNGAHDRMQAIRWTVDSLELTEGDKMYGGDYICYKLGLPYSYSSQFDQVGVL